MKQRESVSIKALYLTLAVALASCGGGATTDAGSPPEILGRVERGSTVTVNLRDAAGASVAATQVAISPAAAGVVTGNTVLLAQAGSATITASGAGRTSSVTLSVAVPPTIYFDAIDQGNRDIYSASLDGQDTQRLTTNPADDQEPTVAKGQLVFSSSRNGAFDLYALTLGTAGERRLTSATANELQPSLSNDGTRLVYSSDASGVARLYVAASDGTGAALLTPGSFNPGASIEVTAKWNSAGDKIVFGATPAGRTNLFITGTSASSVPAAVAGSTSQATDVEPAWSPDGSRIVFASTRAGGTSIFVVNAQTGAVTQLTSNDNSGQPVWLADGRIVFTAFTTSGSSLMWIDPDASPSAVHAIPLSYTRIQHATGAR